MSKISDSETGFLFIGLALGFIGGLVVSAVVDWATGNDVGTWRRKSVQSGAAYWKLEKKTGQTEFTWKHEEEIEKHGQ